MIFPSYVFIELDDDLTSIDYYIIKKTPNVISILDMDDVPISLNEDEASYIRMLSNGGKAIPILNIEDIEDGVFGDVCDYDARQKRCKVRFDFLGKPKELTLSVN